LLLTPACVVLNLVFANFLNCEVVSVWVSEVESADRAGRVHRKRLGQLDASLLLNIH
jgi:hypothetical protein